MTHLVIICAWFLLSLRHKTKNFWENHKNYVGNKKIKKILLHRTRKKSLKFHFVHFIISCTPKIYPRPSPRIHFLILDKNRMKSTRRISKMSKDVSQNIFHLLAIPLSENTTREKSHTRAEEIATVSSIMSKMT